MKLLPYSKVLQETDIYSASLEVTLNRELVLAIDRILKFSDGSKCKMAVAKLVRKDGYHDSYIVWNSDNYFDTTNYNNMEQFIVETNNRLSAYVDWVNILDKFNIEYNNFVRSYQIKSEILSRAESLGRDKMFISTIKDIKFNVDNNIFAYHKSSTLLVFIYKPERKVYIFQLSKEMYQEQINIFNELIDYHNNRVWCTCDDKTETMYVEHFKGVNHGWICVKCNRYTQIG